jgi:enamine deaminase RidA (YjgF/YER057c/UK114 family)
MKMTIEYFAESNPGTRSLPRNKPARSTLQAKNMVGTKIEIEAIAYKPCTAAHAHP